MEKWLILFSVFKNLLKTEIKHTWWLWAEEISLSLFKLISVGGVGFAAWSLYSHLRGYNLEAVAAIQMSGILLGIVVATIFLYFLIKKIIKKYMQRNESNNVYGELFDVSALLYKDLEKVKSLGASLFKKKPLLISGTAVTIAYVLFTLFKDDHLKKNPEPLKKQKS